MYIYILRLHVEKWLRFQLCHVDIQCVIMDLRV